MKINYQDFGNGQPVVLLHAFPLSGAMWKTQAELLVNNGFRVILPDFPGFGENDSSGYYSIAEMAAQIAELLESLSIEKAVIGGLSMGGYVTFELFRLIPEKFSAIILCDTTHLADTDEKRDSRYELISKIGREGANALLENMLPKLISEDTKQNNPALITDLEKTFSKVDPNSAINALRAMAERKNSSDIIEKISVPTLLIFGEFDKVTNLENGEKMNEIIPDSELLIVKKAGHLSNLEQPEQFNEALLNFCKRIKN